MTFRLQCALGAALMFACAAATAQIRVIDDHGRTVTLDRPAQRIVSLAPHITELLFSAGAGGRIVGTVAYSDFPRSARTIPRVGDSSRLDLERIVALRPDLVVAWSNAGEQRQLGPLAGIGVPVFYDGPRSLTDIARSIRTFGELAGTQTVARRAARDFLAVIAALHERYANRPPVRVFYQLWDRPLMTINRDGVISDVIRLCGGRNVFAGLTPLVPLISTEAVIEADPEAMLATDTGSGTPRGLERWSGWTGIEAVERGNLFYIPRDLLSRPSVRILQGARLMCGDLQAARAKRPS